MSVTRAVVVAATVGSLFAASPLTTASATPSHPVGPLTVAVYGDSPYGVSAYAPANQAADTTEYEKSPAFIGTMNADPSVSEVIHVGDVHSGKQFCTEEYDNQIASLWQDFNDPLVYTPGDNEWTDCHKVSSVTSPGEGRRLLQRQHPVLHRRDRDSWNAPSHSKIASGIAPNSIHRNSRLVEPPLGSTATSLSPRG
jgi:hypothetical protein